MWPFTPHSQSLNAEIAAVYKIQVLDMIVTTVEIRSQMIVISWCHSPSYRRANMWLQDKPRSFAYMSRAHSCPGAIMPQIALRIPYSLFPYLCRKINDCQYQDCNEHSHDESSQYCRPIPVLIEAHLHHKRACDTRADNRFLKVLLKFGVMNKRAYWWPMTK